MFNYCKRRYIEQDFSFFTYPEKVLKCGLMGIAVGGERWGVAKGLKIKPRPFFGLLTNPGQSGGEFTSYLQTKLSKTCRFSRAYTA
jgi:hypothetical protein